MPLGLLKQNQLVGKIIHFDIFCCDLMEKNYKVLKKKKNVKIFFFKFKNRQDVREEESKREKGLKNSFKTFCYR